MGIMMSVTLHMVFHQQDSKDVAEIKQEISKLLVNGILK